MAAPSRRQPRKQSAAKRKPKAAKKVTRYTHDDVQEPRTPETGHTALIGAEQVVTLPMDNGWSTAIDVGKFGEDQLVVIDLDPSFDPVFMWSGKRTKRQVPVLPLQRNEVVAESRIARIIERARTTTADDAPAQQGALFADLEKTLRESDRSKRVEFYTHEEGWKNKLICGDSLPVTESLLHYEGLRGKVQMIYVDPPYGIKYDSNFQQRIDSTKNDEKNQADDVLTIKAFRDTWALGIHSYLSYLQERLYLCRELLGDSGSIFVQINDQNVHLVRALLDEAFGRANFVSLITFQKTGSQETQLLGTTVDYLIWYAKQKSTVLYNQLYRRREPGDLSLDRYDQIETPDGVRRALTVAERSGESTAPEGRRFRFTSLLSSGETSTPQEFVFQGETYASKAGSHWKTTVEGMEQLGRQGRIVQTGRSIQYMRYADDFEYVPIDDRWESMQVGRELDYVVQTASSVVERCLLMTTRPGDLVFDPTCGSGTAALAAERFGRRWITCDTSRVALNIARRRLLSSVLDHYVTLNGTPSSGFSYKTVDRVTLRSIAHDLEPEKVELIDQPEIDKGAIRVCGPFEVMTLGRYSLEDWKGFIVAGDGSDSQLENYVSVLCRLYRSDAALQESAGIIHAIVETGDETVGLSVGPISGRVSARQIHEAVGDAVAAGIKEIHILGWAFEANVGEVKKELEERRDVRIELAMIRPDTLAEGLKITKTEMLFSPLALPEVQLTGAEKGHLTISLDGVAVFDRKRRTTEYMKADSGYVSAWYLDEDYDGDCFVDCQMFFDFKKKPAIERTLGIQVDSDEWSLRLTSDPFAIGKYKRAAVKVVDVYGNESTVVKDLT